MLTGAHKIYHRWETRPSPAELHHTREGEEQMNKSTLVVLETGNECAFMGPMMGCCFTALMPI